LILKKRIEPAGEEAEAISESGWERAVPVLVGGNILGRQVTETINSGEATSRGEDEPGRKTKRGRRRGQKSASSSFSTHGMEGDEGAKGPGLL